MKKIAIALLLTSAPAAAETWRTDAFGVMVQDAERARSGWGGHVEVVGPGLRRQSRTAPGPAEDVSVFLGAKSLRAGGQSGQAAAVLTDAGGNLVADGTRATVTLGDRRLEVGSLGGIVAQDIDPGTVAGVFLAGIDAGGRQGPRAEFVVNADYWSARLPEAAVPTLAPETFAGISSGPILDRFGNPVEDGVGGLFTLDHGQGRFTLVPGVTVAGELSGMLLLRDVPGRGRLRGSLADAASGTTEVTVRQLSPAAPLEATAIAAGEIDAATFTIGPFVTDEGYLLPDGAVADILLTDALGHEDRASLWLRDGHVSSLRMISPKAFPVTVEVQSVLGVQTAVVARAGEATP